MQPKAQVGVRADFDVPATMRDGTVLRANVFRPDDGGSGTYPVLLSRLPYGKDLPLGSSALNPAQIARQGYIVVVQDVRGTFTSGGEWRPMLDEGPDGADTVEWAARLPGADGRVGMYGLSYFGYTQWAAAREHPLALRAMSPGITWADPNDGVNTRNGVLELGTVAHWTMQQGIGQLIRRHRGDPQALGRAMYLLGREYDALAQTGYRSLPLEGFAPLAHFDLDGDITELARAGATRDYSRQAPMIPAYDDIEVPTFHMGGWYDIFLQGTLDNFAEMRARGREGQHLLIGPWTHGVFDPVIGDVNFGIGSSGMLLDMQLDLISLQMQFFDRHLKGIPNGFERWPAVKYFLMGANAWKTAETWPPAGVTTQAWYLHSDGGAQSVNGDGRLSQYAPGTESADTYAYDPAHPVPTVGGATLMHPVYRSGPRDQRGVEARRDVLCYTSEPLAEPLAVVGPVSVRLHVASDAPDTDFVARLVDVAPDGTAIPLTDGITRMSMREGLDETPPPLEPGRPYAISIDLWSTANVFQPGHRIRLDVTSSNFPRWERNLNTGLPNGTTTEMRVARQTILHDAEHPSSLALSVLPL